MIGHILTQAGRDPTIINGGAMKNFRQQGAPEPGTPEPGAPVGGRPNNMRSGSSDMIVIESDESDGSIVNYRPALSVITNISKDHKDIHELKKLFGTFAGQTTEKIVINADCPNISSLNLDTGRTVTFSLENNSLYKAESLRLEPFGSSFECQGHGCQGQRFHLRVPGLHNIYNALAAIATASCLGIPTASIQEALEGFQGISRRFDLIGEVEGIRVIDDFAHNPDKIAATLKACTLLRSRLIIVFQPHGFGPTRFLKEELVDSLVSGMSDRDVLFMPEIFYAGGSVSRDISSRELVQSISARGREARYGENKQAILKPLVEETRPGDAVVVMGARDDTLTLFCREILQLLGKKYGRCGII
jgi:UDP-N-acetylmuramate--alanine ligase